MPNEFDLAIDAAIQQEQSANAERDAMIRDHRAMEVLRKHRLQIVVHEFANGFRWGIVNGQYTVWSLHDDPATAILDWEAKYGR